MSMFRYETRVTKEELIERLNTSYPSEQEGRWVLPCGMCFSVPGFGGTRVFGQDWLFRYAKRGDKAIDLPIPFDDQCGMIERGELIHLLDLLEKKEREKPGFDLYKKSRSIRQIEMLTGCVATLNYMGCLQWRCKVDTFSCINNPYDMLRVYASSKDEFEVFISDEDSHEHCPISAVIELLKNKNLIKSSKICASCREIAYDASLLRCSRCKSVCYCNRECQKKHWDARHRTQCIAK